MTLPVIDHVSRPGEEHMSVTIALDALSKDAARWDEVSEALGGAAHSAGGLRLDDSAFSFAGGAAAST